MIPVKTLTWKKNKEGNTWYARIDKVTFYELRAHRFSKDEYTVYFCPNKFDTIAIGKSGLHEARQACQELFLIYVNGLLLV